MADLALTGISKEYGDDVVAVSGFDLDVRDGEFIVLVGPSGCGKSTVLRTIAGLTRPTRGRVRIGGRDVTDAPPKERDVAMVFQNYALYPHMTVRENMAFGLKVRGRSREEIEDRVMEASELLGLSALLDRRPEALSGGQRQRAAVGRALVRSPAVYLFDEPLSNLDAELRTQLRTELKRLHQRLKSTMVYVTHDQAEAMTLADRMVVMRDGRIRQVGPPMAIYERPADRFVATFVGSPAMNLFRGTIRANGGPVFEAAGIRAALSSDVTAGASLPDGQEVELGVRPEDLDLCAPETPVDGPAWLKGRVDLVEPMGSESHVHLRVGEVPAVARLPASDRPDVGSQRCFRVRPDRIHLFRPDNGERLPPP